MRQLPQRNFNIRVFFLCYGRWALTGLGPQDFTLHFSLKKRNDSKREPFSAKSAIFIRALLLQRGQLNSNTPASNLASKR